MILTRAVSSKPPDPCLLERCLRAGARRARISRRLQARRPWAAGRRWATRPCSSWPRRAPCATTRTSRQTWKAAALLSVWASPRRQPCACSSRRSGAPPGWRRPAAARAARARGMRTLRARRTSRRARTRARRSARAPDPRSQRPRCGSPSGGHTPSSSSREIASPCPSSARPGGRRRARSAARTDGGSSSRARWSRWWSGAPPFSSPTGAWCP
mmetsp:Transcript_11867/g.35180  ORF Transcript_11867/g.35180 Transcript_11867/m.35180 type:complete len:214 (-) Transcript_11867:840-1481(-)